MGPHSPDRDRPVSKLAAEVRANGWPARHQGGAHRVLHQLLVRGHAPGGPHRHAGHQGRAPGADAVPDHARVRAHPPDDQARRDHGHVRADGRHGARQRVRALHRPVEAGRRRQGRGQHHRLVVQPELPGPERRQPGDAVLPHEPGDRDRPRLRGHPRVRPGPRDPDGARRKGLPLHAARGRGAPAGRLRARRGGLRGAGGGRGAGPGRRAAGQRAAPAAPALPALGREGLRPPADPRQDQGQDDDRPHLAGGRVAPLSRPPRQDQRQHVPRRAQRVHRRDRQGRQRADRRGRGAAHADRARLEGQGRRAGS